MSKTYSLAVCLFHQATALDYQGPLEILEFLKADNPSPVTEEPLPVTLTIDYLGPVKEPLSLNRGPSAMPTRTYKEAASDQYDILLVPGGE